LIDVDTRWPYVDTVSRWTFVMTIVFYLPYNYLLLRFRLRRAVVAHDTTFYTPDPILPTYGLFAVVVVYYNNDSIHIIDIVTTCSMIPNSDHYQYLINLFWW